MYQSIQVPCGRFDVLSHVILAVEVEDIGHQVQSILVVLNFSVEPGEVESVRQVLLVNLAKVLVAARRDELGNYKYQQAALLGFCDWCFILTGANYSSHGFWNLINNALCPDYA